MQALIRHLTRGRPMAAGLLAAAVAAAGLLGGGGPTPARSSPADPIVAAAGDIACDPHDPEYNAGQGIETECRQLQTSSLLRPSLSAVLPLGDNQYSDGRAWKYRRSYHPSWGRFRAVSHPVPGNHEYAIPNASGYFRYYNGAAADGKAGHRRNGYYSFDVGAWHLVALNSNCREVSCAGGDRQLEWLKADLLAHPAQCTLAYWHHPLFSSAHPGDYTPRIRPFWRVLYAAGADVILNGHHHDYERFKPQDPDGNRDWPHGIRQFVVGTGGRNHSGFPSQPAPNSQVRDGSAFGVLKLTLKPDRYRWRFVPEGHRGFTDRGSNACH